MATPAIRERVMATGPGTAATATTSSAVQTGDLVVCFHNNEWGVVGNMVAPTGSLAGLWTQRALDSNGTSKAHGKLWTALAPSGGAKSVTCNADNGSEVMVTVFVIDVATLHASWFVGASVGQNATASTSWSFSSIALSAAADDLLLGTVGTSGATTTHGTPTGMTKLASQNSRTFATQSVYSQTLASTAATGTKSSTSSASVNYASLLIRLRGDTPVTASTGAFFPFMSL